ncbi:MAG: SPFH domain-containing protein, partial [Flavobacteriaceae bacterium]
MNKLPKLGLPVVVLILVGIIFISKSSVNIGYGEAGVVWERFGGGTVTDEAPLGEGFHIIAPWNRVYIYNIKQQEEFESGMRVLSSNGLEISLDVSVLYQPKL